MNGSMAVMRLAGTRAYPSMHVNMVLSYPVLYFFLMFVLSPSIRTALSLVLPGTSTVAFAGCWQGVSALIYIVLYTTD